MIKRQGRVSVLPKKLITVLAISLITSLRKYLLRQAQCWVASVTTEDFLHWALGCSSCHGKDPQVHGAAFKIHLSNQTLQTRQSEF